MVKVVIESGNLDSHRVAGKTYFNEREKMR